MAREIFGPGIFREESRTIEQIDKKRKKEAKLKTSDWWEEEKQEREDLERLHKESAAKYEGALGVPPPEDWTTEQITETLDKKTAREDVVMAETNRPSGKKSRRAARGWQRGHRKGLKPAKPREQKEAA
ncbi:hypothetical protein HZB93_04390 [Candidatus Falkowbacteria bacterium]|nr:hypothetical protein [Candidatus Falkowbacteria bacterium]